MVAGVSAFVRSVRKTVVVKGAGRKITQPFYLPALHFPPNNTPKCFPVSSRAATTAASCKPYHRQLPQVKSSTGGCALPRGRRFRACRYGGGRRRWGNEGLMAVAQLKRRAVLPPAGANPRLEQFMRSHVSRLLRTDLLAVLTELLRQDHVLLSMKIYSVVWKEIWYRPDMYFYRDMLYMLARNKRIDETRQVWADLKSEDVLFDQHTYGVRAFCDAGLIDLAMEFYEGMRSSPDPPLSLPFRVISKGMIPYPELREKIKHDFLELFPDMIVYDLPNSLSDVDEEFKF